MKTTGRNFRLIKLKWNAINLNMANRACPKTVAEMCNTQKPLSTCRPKRVTSAFEFGKLNPKGKRRSHLNINIDEVLYIWFIYAQPMSPHLQTSKVFLLLKDASIGGYFDKMLFLKQFQEINVSIVRGIIQ